MNSNKNKKRCLPAAAAAAGFRATPARAHFLTPRPQTQSSVAFDRVQQATIFLGAVGRPGCYRGIALFFFILQGALKKTTLTAMHLWRGGELGLDGRARFKKKVGAARRGLSRRRQRDKRRQSLGADKCGRSGHVHVAIETVFINFISYESF
jgi:hypothetical protein